VDPSEAAATLDRLFDRLPSGACADARLDGGRYVTMRFANGWIHQPHREELTELSLRVALGKRIATATTLDLTPAGLARVVEQAGALARSAPEEPAFPGFPGATRAVPSTPYSPATAALSPEAEARWAQAIIDAALETAPNARVSGVAHFGALWRVVANTSGRLVRSRRSIVSARALVERLEIEGTPSGWADEAHYDHRRVDPAAIGREAAERAAPSAPRSVEPGRYRVLLDGSAAAKLVSELAGLGYAARGAEEGWSCLARKRGRSIAPPGLEVFDDGRSAASVPQAIDAEGTPKRRTPLIEHGVAAGPVLDLLTAARMKARPTGHAWPPQAPFGEIGASPQNIIVGPGTARDRDELLAETKRGILVTRFHYVRTVDAGRGVITGMTRDGTYRIERGEIAGPVRNLRFTESVLTALAGAELWGRSRRCYSDDDERGGVVVTAPPMVLRGFRFTSATVV
jgi:PmbA protein